MKMPIEKWDAPGFMAYAQAIRNPDPNDPNWPLPSFDAKDWAKAFCKIAGERGLTIEESWMQTWFANALMRGYDEAHMHLAKEKIALSNQSV